MTTNEAREVLNKPKLEEGDGLVTPLNVLIGGQTSPYDGQTESRGQADTGQLESQTDGKSVTVDEVRRVLNHVGVILQTHPKEGASHADQNEIRTPVKARVNTNETARRPSDSRLRQRVRQHRPRRRQGRQGARSPRPSPTGTRTTAPASPVYWNHDVNDPFKNLGLTSHAEEDDHGLKVAGQIDTSTELGRQVAKLLKEGRVSQMSFAYDVTEGAWIDGVKRDDGAIDPGYYEIRGIDLYEVSICPIGMNQATEVSAKTAILGLAPDQQPEPETKNDPLALNTDRLRAPRTDHPNPLTTTNHRKETPPWAIKTEIEQHREAARSLLAKATGEGRGLTQDEQTEFDGHMTAAETLVKALHDAEENTKRLDGLFNTGKTIDAGEAEENDPPTSRAATSASASSTARPTSPGTPRPTTWAQAATSASRRPASAAWATTSSPRPATPSAPPIAHLPNIRMPLVDQVNRPEITLLRLHQPRHHQRQLRDYLQIISGHPLTPASSPRTPATTESDTQKPQSTFTTELAEAKVYDYADGYTRHQPAPPGRPGARQLPAGRVRLQLRPQARRHAPQRHRQRRPAQGPAQHHRRPVRQLEQDQRRGPQPRHRDPPGHHQAPQGRGAGQRESS